MTTGHVFIATSLDGYIARPDHDLDWLMKQQVEGEDHGYDGFIAEMDGVVMGSASYEKLLSFPDWPYSVPVVVLSHSLDADDIPDHLADKVRLSRARPFRLMERLAEDGWKKVYVDGGTVIQSFLRAGLISEMTISLVPILLGHGRKLFGPLDRDIDLVLEEVTAFPSGLVATRYSIPAPARSVNAPED